MNLRKKAIAAMVLFVALPLTLMSLVSSCAAPTVITEKTVTLSEQSTEKLAQYLSHDMQTLSRQVEGLSTNGSLMGFIRQADEGETSPELSQRRIQACLYGEKGSFEVSYPTAYILITSGGSVYSSLTYSPYGETPAILEKVRDASWYQRLSGIIYPSRKIITEENLLLPRNGEDQIYFVSNITDGRTNYGVLMIGINRSYFSGLLENFKPTENSLSCLYSADTAIWNDATLLDGSGPESFPDTGGYTEIVRDVPGVGESGWKLASFIPRDDISKESRSILVLGIVLVGFAALCTVLLIVVINRAVVLPVSQLSGLMRQVQDGRLDVRAQIRSHDEIGNLGAGFNSMVSRLKENIEQIQEEENSKRELELKMLQAQIDPHFIRNTLNTIRWMAELRKATGISRALSSFIRLMDYSFRSRAPAVTVREECEYLQEYIYLQKLRYQNRFEFTLHADEELLDVPILRLLVQPLLENSLVHGLAEKDGFGNLSVDFCREEDRMCVCVRDDGVGMEEQTVRALTGQDGAPSANGRESVGLRNVRERLRLHYGESCTLQIQSEPGQGTAISFRLPLENGVCPEREGKE